MNWFQRLVVAGLIWCGAFLAHYAHNVRAAEVAEKTAYVPLPKGEVTWSKQIAPIVYNNCSNCHRPGEVAPFPLMNYDDAKKRARQMAIVTESRFMPPWKADEGKEKFQDAHRLTDEEIGLIGQWAKDGAPEGDKATAPAPPTFVAGWQNGQPDVVLQPESKYDLAAEGDDVYRCFVIPTNYDDRSLCRGDGSAARQQFCSASRDCVSGYDRDRRAKKTLPLPGRATPRLAASVSCLRVRWAAGRRV